ncbi:MAG: molybdate ABC transporter substrate-binding protein [Rhodobacteraceae bacterium]|nr:molybdate ABC transporter substrate-binding protein [Paracoccaceae bacterium]
MQLRALFRTLITSLALCLSVSGTARAEAPVIFAAASLRGALDEIADAHEAATGQRPVISYAGSSTLARQISLGAPADLFISANEDWMNWLDDRALLEPGTRRPLIRNSLVVIGAAEAAPMQLSEMPARLGDGRLAMALVEAVPAGTYGRAALEHLGLWDAVAPQVAQADNVRAALALVSTGAAPLGIVYASDAQADPRVAVLADIPPEAHAPILYPVALVAGQDRPDTRALLARLTSANAQDIFLRHGFEPLGARE